MEAEPLQFETYTATIYVPLKVPIEAQSVAMAKVKAKDLAKKKGGFLHQLQPPK